MHQAIGTADARGVGGVCFAAQTCHRAAHQIDLRPAQLKALERLAVLGVFAQTGDLTVGHVEHDRGIGPVDGLDQQAHARHAFVVGLGRDADVHAAFNQRLGGLRQIKRQAPANQAVVGRQGPARLGGGAEHQALRGDLRAVGDPHARRGAAVDRVVAGERDLLLKLDRDLRGQHHIAHHLHGASHVDAGTELQVVGADGELAQLASEAVARHQQHVVLSGQRAGAGNVDGLDVDRQAGRAQVHVVDDQAVDAAFAADAQNAGGLGKNEVVWVFARLGCLAIEARQPEHAVAVVAQAHLAGAFA